MDKLTKLFGMFFGWIELILLTTVLYPLSWLPERSPPRQWYVSLFRIWCKAWVHALGVNLQLAYRNTQTVPDQFILIANHPSAFEDVGIPALFNVYSLAKKGVSRWLIVGRISKAAGTLYVKRDSPTSRQKATKEIIERLDSGANIVIYPEGGIKGKNLHSHFKYGIFNISKKTGIPIMPVYLQYESIDDFYWDKQSLPRKIMELMMAESSNVNFYVYDAFYPENFSDKETYCDHVYQCFRKWESI